MHFRSSIEIDQLVEGKSWMKNGKAKSAQQHMNSSKSFIWVEFCVIRLCCCVIIVWLSDRHRSNSCATCSAIDFNGSFGNGT